MVVKHIKRYERLYRHPDRERLVISDVHPLNPKRPDGDVPRYDWPQAWPLGDRHGVYVFFTEANQMLYVGKAGPRRTLGERLSEYFWDKRSGRAQFYWSQWFPAAVLTVAVPADSPFEVASLETYLIETLRPPWNTLA